MANTTNLGLGKLAGTEKLKTFPGIQADNMDKIDAAFGAGFGIIGASSVNAELNSLGDGLAILANGNTHAAITSGRFVYVRGHGTLSDGLYVATSNISANATLTGSNLTADTAGGLNTVYSSLNNKITTNDITSSITFESVLPVTDNTKFKVNNQMFDLMVLSNGNVTINDNTLVGTITNSNYRPKTGHMVAVFNYTTSKPINGSMFIGTDGTIKYYGENISSKHITFHDVFLNI